MTNKQKIIDIFETIIDPELGIDIWTMGLIYDINIVSEKQINILMTYTSPNCPLGEQIQQDIRSSLSQAGFEKIGIEVTFEPRWTPSEKFKKMIWQQY